MKRFDLTTSTGFMTGLATVLTTVLELSLTGVGTAAAMPYGTWRPYGNTNPIVDNWHCGATEDIVPGIKAQTCVIRSADGGSVQGAVIVRNNYSYSRFPETGAIVALFATAYSEKWWCVPSGIAGNSWSVCFGKTRTLPGKAYTKGSFDNRDLGASPIA